ncbi:hypothetical protein [Sandaracinobacteroides hominis]|uniref:hypothetical protein n=1 Tax=Sandaracinobacteroides hominis TaxID=2780086 RepID=UPI0018F5DAAD|nr:hypothetical protein [Sandaracinobacteroides hominis]
MSWQAVWNSLIEQFSGVSFVTSGYGQSLRDNFITLNPADPGYPQKLAEQDKIRNALEAEISKIEPNFTQLFAIEIKLAEILPDEHVTARFWAVEDRFRRIVPTSSQTSYMASIPSKGERQWKDTRFLRQQTLALLEVIHSDILINFYREKSINRLKLFLFIIVLIAAATAYTINSALSLLFVCGVLGAATSVMQRLQTAVANDAMTQDGLFELIGLRLGWIGISLSALWGGIFALLMYCIVMAGALELAAPARAGEKATQSIVSANLDQQANAPDAVVPPDRNAPSGRPNMSATCMVAQNGKDEKPVANALDTLGCRHSVALGLNSGADFFKILLLAFIAGFAERLVPDILSRISKKYSSALN